MTEYYQKKKEAIYKYYQKNKERIRAKEVEKVKCDICNCEVQKKHMVKHIRLNKHLNNLSKFVNNQSPQSE